MISFKRHFTRLIILLLIFISCFFLAAVTTLAEEKSDPRVVVENIFERIKEAGSFKGMIPFVHWDTAFKRLSPEMKKELKVSSGKELRKKAEEEMNDPTAVVRRLTETTLDSAGESEKDFVRQQLALDFENIVQEMRGVYQESERELKNTTYIVKDVRETGDTASVDVLVTREGETELSTYSLIKIDNKWYLPEFWLYAEGGEEDD